MTKIYAEDVQDVLEWHPCLMDNTNKVCDCGYHFMAWRGFIEDKFTGVESESCPNCDIQHQAFTYCKKEDGNWWLKTFIGKQIKE